MKLSLEKINKTILLMALIYLIYRFGNFCNTLLPKPFEAVLIIVLILTTIDLIKNKKIKEFWLSIPRKIWIALLCLFFSVLSGWAMVILFKKIPFSMNAILEFGTFSISCASAIWR